MKAVFVDFGVDAQAMRSSQCSFLRETRSDRFARSARCAHRGLQILRAFDSGRQARVLKGDVHGQALKAGSSGRRTCGQFTATEEEVDGGADGLGVHQIRDFAQLINVLDAHSFLDGSAKFQEALAHLFDGKFIQCSQTSVAKVIDIIDVRLVPFGT